MLRRSATRRRRPLATSLYDRQAPTAAALRGTLHLLYVGGTGQDAPRVQTASACCWIRPNHIFGSGVKSCKFDTHLPPGKVRFE